MTELSRRHFLTYVGIGSYGLMQQISALGAPSKTAARSRSASWSQFPRVAPSTDDLLLIPKSYRYDLLASEGDDLGSTGPSGKEFFGSDADLNVFFPIDALEQTPGAANFREGLLWTNHEFFTPHFLPGFQTPGQLAGEKHAVGGSVLHIKRGTAGWKREGSPFTRRYTASYPQIDLTGPAKVAIPRATGTLANCSGGSTPWHTVLSCEENYSNFTEKALGWDLTDADARQYGWVVEIDPFGKLPPKKHSCLGRFAHENAAVTQGKSGKVVIYMGDDAQDQYFYKFISADTLKKESSRAEKSSLLENGTLYAADFENGKWIALDLEQNPALKKEGFKSQAEILVDTRRAAKAVKATPLDRPEDCELHPRDGSVYLALTNNARHGNLYGQLVRLIEAADDAEALSFRYEIFLAGGPQSGLACPDNLAFDAEGNLWVTCDIGSGAMNKGAYTSFGNNGLYRVLTSGKERGTAHQFASAPRDAELTGPWFTPNQETLFLSVQHPGEASPNLKTLTSHWPHGGNSIPRSSVVAISKR